MASNYELSAWHSGSYWVHAHATSTQVPDHSDNVMSQIEEAWKSAYEMLDQALATENFKLERTLVGFLVGESETSIDLWDAGERTYVQYAWPIGRQVERTLWFSLG